MKEKLTDEILNAFVDEQLTAEDKERVFRAIEEDGELAEKLCELRRVKDMVRHVYRSPPQPARLGSWRQSRRHPAVQAAAVMGLLIAGGLLGWAGHHYTETTPSSQGGLVFSLPDAPSLATAKGVIVHVNSSQGDKVERALDRTAALVEQLQQSGRRVPVEVLANGTGLDMLRVGSAEEIKIRALQKRYGQLTFIACQRALEIIREKTGNEIDLLPGTRTDTTALDLIVRRLREGWVYVRI